MVLRRLPTQPVRIKLLAYSKNTRAKNTMTVFPPSPFALRTSRLVADAKTPFKIETNAALCEQLRAELDLVGLKKLRFTGHVRAEGRTDWRLEGQLGATIIQLCVVTLEPVSTRIETKVTRLFQKDFTYSEEEELEMPQDDSAEPLGLWIDPLEIMAEELSLALPQYPRKEDAAEVALSITEPGKTPMSDEEAKPFAGLGALKAQLSGE
jgi:uncharacterized metal-binding protein YceD (DUF177 family)